MGESGGGYMLQEEGWECVLKHERATSMPHANRDMVGVEGD